MPISSVIGSNAGVATVPGVTASEQAFRLNESDIDVGDPLVPSDAILAHLDKKSGHIVEIDFPENITAAGLTHQEVLEAARYYVVNGAAAQSIGPGSSGYWVRGELRLQSGVYQLSNQLELPARLCIKGLGGSNIKDAGTRFQAIAGGDLESGGAAKYVIHCNPADGTQWDGNFYSHLVDFEIDCENLCSGLKWGGAQCSSLKRIQTPRVAAGGVGFYIGFGSNGVHLEDLWAYGNYNGTNSGFFIDDYIYGLALIGCKSENCQYALEIEGNSSINILGFYNEGCDQPLIVNGGGGTTVLNAWGFDSKAIKGRNGSGKALLFTLPALSDSININGRFRDISDAGTPVQVGYEVKGTYFNLEDDASVAGANHGFEVFTRKKMFNIPTDLNDGTALTIGRRYFENLVGVAARTYTFSEVDEEEDFVELFMITDTSLTLTIPTSRLAGSTSTTTSTVLAIGNHHLKWERVNSEWWLTIS